jgi:hypothetical protein
VVLAGVLTLLAVLPVQVVEVEVEILQHLDNLLQIIHLPLEAVEEVIAVVVTAAMAVVIYQGLPRPELHYKVETVEVGMLAATTVAVVAVVQDILVVEEAEEVVIQVAAP